MEELIILTGFMAAGKSAVGRALATRLGWDFVDLDEAVQAEAGKTVSAIFEHEGEQRFRDLEAQALTALLGRTRLVVATGGGILLREENRRHLSGRLVVNLDVSPAECERRLADAKTVRPLLAGADRWSRVRRLFEERRPLYEAVPRHVDTDGKSTGEVAAEVFERFLGGGAS